MSNCSESACETGCLLKASCSGNEKKEKNQVRQIVIAVRLLFAVIFTLCAVMMIIPVVVAVVELLVVTGHVIAVVELLVVTGHVNCDVIVVAVAILLM